MAVALKRENAPFMVVPRASGRLDLVGADETEMRFIEFADDRPDLYTTGE
jgi:hypothetical protein